MIVLPPCPRYTGSDLEQNLQIGKGNEDKAFRTLGCFHK